MMVLLKLLILNRNPYNTKFVNSINSNNSVKDILDKDFIEIKELLLNKNAK